MATVDGFDPRIKPQTRRVAAREKQEVPTWLKIGGAVMSLALMGTSLGLCSRGWVTPAEAAETEEKLKDEAKAAHVVLNDRMDQIQKVNGVKLDKILERLPQR